MNPKSNRTVLVASALMAAFLGGGGGVVSASTEASQAYDGLNARIRANREAALAFNHALPAAVQAKRAQWLAVRASQGMRGHQGWSVRQGQRMARKARNVARNRRAHRG